MVQKRACPEIANAKLRVLDVLDIAQRGLNLFVVGILELFSAFVELSDKFSVDVGLAVDEFLTKAVNLLVFRFEINLQLADFFLFGFAEFLNLVLHDFQCHEAFADLSVHVLDVR